MNRLFYYEVDGTRFYNNVSAFQHLTKVKNTNNDAKIKFVLNFDSFKNYQNYGWDKEPPESASYYMRQHASLLYEKNKNLVLWYSGGTDSHAIANVFLDLQIPIHLLWCDVFSRYWEDSNHPVVHCRRIEWEQQIKPDVDEWIKRANKTKHLFDFSETIMRGPKGKEMEKFLGSNKFEGSYQTLRDMWNLPATYINEDKTKFGKSGIFGYEKPWLVIHKGWWCHTLSDAVVANIGPNHLNDNIWFFITDLVPNLHIKLTWNRMKAIEKIMIDYNLPMTNTQAIAIQNTNSIYYTLLNNYCGYYSVNDYLRSPHVKLHEDSKLEDTIGYRVNQIMNIVGPQRIVLDDYLDKEIHPTIHENYLHVATKRPVGISTQIIPIKPVKDFRDAKK